MEIKNILESLHDEVEGGKLTLHQAGVELYRAGWFNFLPNDNAIKSLLKL